MAWKESSKVDERKKFILRLLNGDKMTDLCLEFNISRKTGYKIYDRFMLNGEPGLLDQSRRPKRFANLIDSGLSELVLKYKKEKPTWGAPKLRELLIRKHSFNKIPAISTIHALLDKNGLVRHRDSRRKYKATGTLLSNPKEPNDLWCTDYKGQFAMGNKMLCYPLTITDQVSRYLIGVEAMEAISEKESISFFKLIFNEYGLPNAIRSDNGVPFATRGLFGLSKLSVWWLRNGIKLERIKPGNPQQNGQHERMHKTLKLSVAKPPANNIFSQQEKIDTFIKEFNFERPHEALNMKTPSQVYIKSQNEFQSEPDQPDYNFCDYHGNVTLCGSLYTHKKRRIYIGNAFAGQPLGVKEVDNDIFEVYFMDYLLGYFDENELKFSEAENPFALNL